ncbi:hypothetical protein M0804_012504 [Polistes exclamans]|nr:hypothetical protein M0804_012504 [Polistes exclamans]
MIFIHIFVKFQKDLIIKINVHFVGYLLFQAMKMSKVGNQTNSQDPQAVNSRVFVGNLNTFQCSKTDVERMFQRYGRLAGISMHKGYAFVQFTNPFDARSACLGEDGRTILSQILGKLLYYSTNDNLAVLRANFNHLPLLFLLLFPPPPFYPSTPTPLLVVQPLFACFAV